MKISALLHTPLWTGNGRLPLCSYFTALTFWHCGDWNPQGLGEGVAECKKTTSCSFTCNNNVFVPTWREFKYMGGCSLLQDPYLIHWRHNLCRPPYRYAFTACHASLNCFISFLLFHLQHQAVITYWICIVFDFNSPEFCNILGPGCIWYSQLTRSFDMNVKIPAHIWVLIKMEPSLGISC